MKERGIIMSAPMVRALLDGSKTQTRRICKKQPVPYDGFGGAYVFMNPMPGYIAIGVKSDVESFCPYGVAGDRLWVRETFCADFKPFIYRADGISPTTYGGEKIKWTPSIFMPRAYSRITLELTGVRVERVQDISESDAKAEGVTPIKYVHQPFHTGALNARFSGEQSTCRTEYRHLWDSLHGKGAWEKNPWVWVLEFKKL